jgi:hypothetical protein
MKNQVLAILIILCSITAFAQKIKKKGNTIYKDGAACLTIEKDKAVPGSYFIDNLNGTRLFYIRVQSYYDPATVSKGNPTGRISYLEICNAIGDTIFFEYSATKKRICKLLLTEGIIESNGQVNLVKLEQTAKRIGTSFSRRRFELSY